MTVHSGARFGVGMVAVRLSFGAEMTLADKLRSRSRLQRYRLTAAGKHKNRGQMNIMQSLAFPFAPALLYLLSAVLRKLLAAATVYGLPKQNREKVQSNQPRLFHKH